MLLKQRLGCALVALAATLGAAARAAPDSWPDRPVADPHYGDALFHFFQGKHFSAVTGLMVSQRFDRMPHHRDDAELLRGGLLLSYGVHREAAAIFEKLIEQGAAPPVRDRAWFYLAKIRWQRGLPAAAEAAIGRIGEHLPPALQDERVLLHAQLLMARGDFAGAAKLLADVRSTGEAAQYARYNLGVALVRSGEVAQGMQWLDAVGKASFDGDELRALRDRANVALGFAALQGQQPAEARGHLQRVRLNGLHSNPALLGFGWAAAALGEPKSALVPWQELAAREPDDAAALEARLAVPYAYAQLGAFGHALARYDEAIALFERERAGIERTIAALRSGDLARALLDRNPGAEMGWLRGITELPPELPHARHLMPLFAQHEFQEAFKNWRDLRFLDINLRQWRGNLGTFGDMLANRRKAYAERLPQVRAGARDGAGAIAPLQQRRDALAAELAQAEADADGVALADAKQRALLARLGSVRSALQGDLDAQTKAAASERARLVAGALTWQLAQDHPARLWDARKSFAAIDTELLQARRRDAALAQAQRDEPARFDAFAARIAAAAARIDALLPVLAKLSDEQQHALQEIAVVALLQQQRRLDEYLAQARFAVAQLHDRALLAKEGGDAAK